MAPSEEAEIDRLHAELDEADAYIANLLGIGELAGAWPEGSSRDKANASFQRRSVERANR